jgi:hypothetical protein
MQVDSCKGLARLGAWLGILFATTANAQTYRLIVNTEYLFAADRSFVYTEHRELTPLTQSVLQSAAQVRFTVNGNQTFEVIEAYTRKSDGQQIAVNMADIVSQDGAVGPMLPMWTSKSGKYRSRTSLSATPWWRPFATRNSVTISATDFRRAL